MSPLRFRYQTYEFGDIDIHVRALRDRQQFDDAHGVAERLGVSPASWPLFGVVWAGGEALARWMQDYVIDELRILEVGCGLGLASLLLNQRHADITATDYHPSAQAFLEQNTLLNQGRPIPFVRTGWGDAATDLGRFDLIIGSDLLYEPDHAELLASFMQQHARPRVKVILFDPGRGNSARFTRYMDGFGFQHRRTPAQPDPAQTQAFTGTILEYQREVGA